MSNQRRSSDWTSLPERVLQHAHDGRRTALVQVCGEGTSLSYEALSVRVRQCVANLRALGVAPGDHVAVGMASRWEVVVVVLALQHLGCILVPLLDFVPFRRRGYRADRVIAALRAGRARWSVVAGHGVESYEAVGREERLSMRVVALEAIVRDAPGNPAAEIPTVDADTGALLQFSSGSTAAPKGIFLSHGNLLANLSGIAERLRVTPSDTVVTWLPLYHDMGIVTLLVSLWAGATHVLLSPHDFVRDPLHWIETLSRCHATITVAPQFAYTICLQKSERAWDRLRSLDLSTLRVALNGSEPVDWPLSQTFVQRFARIGLRAHVLQPAYGLAENVVAVALRDPETPVPVKRFSRMALAEGRTEAPISADDAVISTGHGRPVAGTEIRIRTARGEEVVPGRVGQVFVNGKSTARRVCDHDGRFHVAGRRGWVATGDLGVIVDRELHVVGRIKEMFKYGGRSYSPTDIEGAIVTAMGVVPGTVAAFGTRDPRTGTERPVIVIERPRGCAEDELRSLPKQVRVNVLRHFQIPVGDVLVARTGGIPRTSSGKIRRAFLRQAYDRGEISEAVHLSA